MLLCRKMRRRQEGPRWVDAYKVPGQFVGIRYPPDPISDSAAASCDAGVTTPLLHASLVCHYAMPSCITNARQGQGKPPLGGDPGLVPFRGLQTSCHDPEFLLCIVLGFHTQKTKTQSLAPLCLEKTRKALGGSCLLRLHIFRSYPLNVGCKKSIVFL